MGLARRVYTYRHITQVTRTLHRRSSSGESRSYGQRVGRMRQVQPRFATAFRGRSVAPNSWRNGPSRTCGNRNHTILLGIGTSASSLLPAKLVGVGDRWYVRSSASSFVRGAGTGDARLVCVPHGVRDGATLTATRGHGRPPSLPRQAEAASATALPMQNRFRTGARALALALALYVNPCAQNDVNG